MRELYEFSHKSFSDITVREEIGIFRHLLQVHRNFRIVIICCAFANE